MKFFFPVLGCVFLIGITSIFGYEHKQKILDIPPVNSWVFSKEIDEPQSAFHSIGLTLWHMERNAKYIEGFHRWLMTKGIEPKILLSANKVIPKDFQQILLEPERVPNSGWVSTKDSITSRGGHRGPEARLPLVLSRAGMFRFWIRYQGHSKGTAVTSLSLFKKGNEKGEPILYEEFNTKVASKDGLAWHDFMMDMEPGEYTIVLGHVVRYYHANANVSFQEHKIECLYLTDEIWKEAPTDEFLANLSVSSERHQIDKNPLITNKEKDLWLKWQVRPIDWEKAYLNEGLFRLSYAYWQDQVSSISQQDYGNPPKDPVRTTVPDYREPRRQIIFDPIWNMVGNPFRIRQQKEILKNDINEDPAAKDADFDWIYPGKFPVVTGQWIREGGGLSADHAATNATAMGRYTVRQPGKWHLWVQFKNINYFEHYAIHAVSNLGQKAVWERSERLYPGGRSAWSKVGTLDIPELSSIQVAEQRQKASKGIFIKNGEPIFVNHSGHWNRNGNSFQNTMPEATLWSSSGLLPEGDFKIQARLSISENPTAASGFYFHDEHGLQENYFDFDGKVHGPSLEQGSKNMMNSLIHPNEPFDLEVSKKNSIISIFVNGVEAGNAKLKDHPSRQFGFRAGKNTLRVHSFSASGKLDDGLVLNREIKLSLLINKYINPRTYRGVYRLFITNDSNYKPEGNISPKPSLARYESELNSMGGNPKTGYVMNLSQGIGSINQTWMPGPEPAQPKFSLSMAQNTTQSSALFFRNVLNEPITLKIIPGRIGPEVSAKFENIRWRAVAFTPYGENREEWSPFFLLRRPFLIIPPRSVAQAWLTFDSSGIPPGKYSSEIRIESSNISGAKSFPDRIIRVDAIIQPISIEPKNPILVHGWVNPPPGDKYLQDWFKRFNVWQGPFFSKSEMNKYGIRQQVWCQRSLNEKQIRGVIEEAKAKGLTCDDWMISVNDEPTGKTAKELADYLAIGKMIRELEPKLKITMNPGEAANAETFRILQPFVDLWNPYKLHLTYGPSGRDYLKKPWIWYTTPCYQDKSPGIASEMYDQIRSVLRQPGECVGTAFFAPYYPWRDPWDTAYEHIRDVSVFFLPSRHGPVATPAWEAILEAVQHANLARMVREKSKPADMDTKKLWEFGSVGQLCDWLVSHP